MDNFFKTIFLLKIFEKFDFFKYLENIFNVLISNIQSSMMLNRTIVITNINSIFVQSLWDILNINIKYITKTRLILLLRLILYKYFF